MKVASRAAVPMTQEIEKSVRVFWLPKEISQSHEHESKACTLIALQFLQNCQQARVEFSFDYPSPNLIDEFKKSIEQGNEIYDSLRESGKLQAKYLNVPEALAAITPKQASPVVVEWKSFFYDTPMSETLYSNLKENVKQWQTKKPSNAVSDVSVILIANLRAVAIVFTKNPKSVTLMDSHAHCPYGAVIAMVPQNCLENLCRWYAYQLAKDTHPNPVTCYELSFLYHQS